MLGNFNLNNWDVSNVENMETVFWMCSSITEIDITKWNTSKATSMREMFCYTTMLDIVKVGDGWDTSKANTNDMFAGSKINEVTRVN